MSDRKAENFKRMVAEASSDPSLIEQRVSLAKVFERVFGETGERLHTAGHVYGNDRKKGASPFGHGTDEAVGVSLLLRLGSQLISASTDLTGDGRLYAGAALVRQLVEIEYLAWAFEARDKDAERWLRSDKRIRQEFFRPAKLREAANGKFRSKDYGYHCEFGGHPTPKAPLLLKNETSTAQLFIVDLLGHAAGIWDHLYGWCANHAPWNAAFVVDADEICTRFNEWKKKDPLSSLSPPS